MAQTDEQALGVGASIGLYLEAVSVAARMRSHPNHNKEAVVSMLRACEKNIDMSVKASATDVALEISDAIRGKSRERENLDN